MVRILGGPFDNRFIYLTVCAELHIDKEIVGM